MRAKVGSSEGEESRVHGSHEEEDNDEDTDTSNTADGADGSSAGNGEGGVDHEEEVGLEDRGETSGDETTDGESDQSVRQHLRALRVADSSRLVRIVDEESSAGNLQKKVSKVSRISRWVAAFNILPEHRRSRTEQQIRRKGCTASRWNQRQ